MKSIADALWRVAVLAALCWVGVELHALRVEVQEPVPDQTVASASEIDGDELDEVRDDVADIKEKVNAILTVLARAK